MDDPPKVTWKLVFWCGVAAIAIMAILQFLANHGNQGGGWTLILH